MVRATGSVHEIAWSLGEQGNVAFSLGLAPEAHALFDESLALARELDDTFLTGWNLFGLAFAAFLDGDLATMEANLHEALDLTRDLYQPWGIAWAQFSLGVVSIMNGDDEAAAERVTESLELRWSIHDARGTADSLGLLAYLASRHGELAWAAGSTEQTRSCARPHGLTLLPFLQPLHAESVDRIREVLGEESLAERWRAGRETPLEKTVAEVLGAARTSDGT